MITMKSYLGNIATWASRAFVALMVIAIGPAIAQTKVVVIPMSGDDLKPLQNVVSVAKQNGDFSSPIAALDSISDASASNPYLVVIAPGIYDLGNETLTLKPFVNVQGSGKDVTIVRTQSNVEDTSTVRLVENSTLAHLTIINDGNPATTGRTYGVVAEGENFRLLSCKIHAQNPSFFAVGFAMDGTQSDRVDGVLDDVEVIVSGDFDRGLGRFDNSTFAGGSVLTVRNSHFKVTSTGTAISALGLRITDSKLLVSDTLIELLSAGTGISNSDGEDDIYQNIFIVSDADNARALSGAGSGFRPTIENSHIKLTGAGSIAAISNNGRPVIRNSYVEAEVVFSRTSQTVFTPTYEVESSVLSGSRIASHDFAGGNIILRLGASKLDAFTLFDPGSGTIEAVCANSYDRNYDPLSEGCN